MKGALAELSALRLKFLEEHVQPALEDLYRRQAGLCEAFDACQDAEEKLRCLREMGKLDELFKQFARLSPKRGVAYAAKGLEKPADLERQGEVDALTWFMEDVSKGLPGLLRDLLHLMQVEESAEYKARFEVLMPLLNASTQQLRLLYQKAVKRGDLEKKTRSAVRENPGKPEKPEKPEGGEDAPKRRKKDEDPLKAAVRGFAAEALYAEYVMKVFGKKRSLPELVSKQKADPSPAPPEELQAVCKAFLASLKKVVDELRAGGCNEVHIKQRAEAWYIGRQRDGDHQENWLMHVLKVMTELMDEEPRPDPAAIKRERSAEVPATLVDEDAVQVMVEVVQIE